MLYQYRRQTFLEALHATQGRHVVLNEVSCYARHRPQCMSTSLLESSRTPCLRSFILPKPSTVVYRVPHGLFLMKQRKSRLFNKEEPSNRALLIYNVPHRRADHPGELITFAKTNEHHNYVATLQSATELYCTLHYMNLLYSTLRIILTRS